MRITFILGLLLTAACLLSQDLQNSTPRLNKAQALSTSINGPGELAYQNGLLYIVESEGRRLLRLDLKNAVIEVVLAEPKKDSYSFDYPNAVATDNHGDVFIADFNGRLRKIDFPGDNAEVLLSQASKPSESLLEVPASMVATSNGDLLIVDRHHKLFRWVFASRTLETLAGNGIGGYGGDGGLAKQAELHFPSGVAIGSAGDIFIADSENCRIRKVDHETQIIVTVAGTGECASKGDGELATKAGLNYPSSMVIDGSGNLFFVEGATDRVRRIDASGIVTTYAGNGKKGFSGDGGPANKATLNNPSGLAVDETGNLFISEFVNNRVRRVDANTRRISTVAGDGSPKRNDVEL